MIHQKLPGLMTPIEKIVRVANSASAMAESTKTGPSGSISVTNSDGTRTVLGAVNATGSTMATHVGDTTPPGVPTNVTAWSGDGSVHVAWDGTLTGGIPADFDHVNLLVEGTRVAQLVKAGSTTYLDVTVGSTVSVTATSEDDACATDGTPAHNVSEACTAIPVVVTDVAAGLSKLIRETEDGVDVGKSADGTTYADGMSVTRQGTDGTFSILKALAGVLLTVASFGESVIELGKNSASAIIKMCGGKVSVSAVPSGSGRYTGVLIGDYGVRMRSANGTASLGVDGFQDLISMVSGYLQIDDGTDALTQVSMNRFLTAIQPVVLYNGGAALDYDTAPGAGTTGAVTLSEDVSNFKEITIFFNYDVWANSSVTLTNPSGKTAGLYLMFVGADGNIWIKTRNISIGGTSMTNATKAANLAFSLTNGACVLAKSYDTPEIEILRVTGRR